MFPAVGRWLSVAATAVGALLLVGALVGAFMLLEKGCDYVFPRLWPREAWEDRAWIARHFEEALAAVERICGKPFVREVPLDHAAPPGLDPC